MSDALWTLDGEDGTVFSTLFDTRLTLHAWNGPPEDYVAACVAHFNALPTATLDHLCQASIRYCNDFLDMIGAPPRTFEAPRDVLALIRPNSLNVPVPEGDAEPVVHLESDCEWEPEHGLEWVVRGGRVISVGPYEGARPWREPDPDDAYLFGPDL